MLSWWGKWDFVLGLFHVSPDCFTSRRGAALHPHRLAPSVTKPVTAPTRCRRPSTSAPTEFHPASPAFLRPWQTTVAHDEKWPYSDNRKGNHPKNGTNGILSICPWIPLLSLALPANLCLLWETKQPLLFNSPVWLRDVKRCNLWNGGSVCPSLAAHANNLLEAVREQQTDPALKM